MNIVRIVIENGCRFVFVTFIVFKALFNNIRS